MSDYEVDELAPNEYQIWDEFVKKSPYGTIYHQTGWFEICARESGLPFKIICVKNKNDKIVGGVPFFQHQTRYFKIFNDSSFNLTPFGGFVIEQLNTDKKRKLEEWTRGILRALNTYLTKHKYDFIRIRSSPEFVDIRYLLWNGWQSSVSYNYYLKLSDDIETTIGKEARYNHRKAQKNNIVIEALNDPLVYYQLLGKTYGKKDKSVKLSDQFFVDIFEYFINSGQGQMWIAKNDEGQVIAAEIILWDEISCYRWAAASDPEFLSTGVTSFLLVEVFKQLRGRGFDQINLMGANVEALSNFVSSFNPTLRALISVEKTPKIVRFIELFKK